jgi:hypothetical protein
MINRLRLLIDRLRLMIDRLSQRLRQGLRLMINRLRRYDLLNWLV